MEQRYLIDSNVLIDYVALRLPKNGSDFVENLFNYDFLISVVVKIEVLGFNELKNKIQAMEEFINSATVLLLDDSITKQTILLRRKYKSLKLGDAIISATAITNHLTLITNNTKDFKNIAEIEILSPYNL